MVDQEAPRSQSWFVLVVGLEEGRIQHLVLVEVLVLQAITDP